MSDLWMDRVNTQTALRMHHDRQIRLAGWGVALDAPLWPIIDRLWALGILTVGSCVGHYDAPGAHAFVAVARSYFDKAAYRRWMRIVESFIEPTISPGIVFAVTVDRLESRYYPNESESYADLRTRALSLWCDKLDVAGRACLEQEPLWEPWSGPALDVPSTVEPERMLMDFVEYMNTLEKKTRWVFSDRLKGIPWARIARDTHQTIPDARAMWNAGWVEWVSRQKSLSEK